MNPLLTFFGHMMYGWGPGGWFWMSLMMAFWVVAAVVVIYLLERTFSKGETRSHGEEGTPSGGDTPLEIVRRRYAAGEISREQLEEIEEKLRE